MFEVLNSWLKFFRMNLYLHIVLLISLWILLLSPASPFWNALISGAFLPFGMVLAYDGIRKARGFGNYLRRGMHTTRIKQLLFSEFDARNSKFFISEFWFDIVERMAGSTDVMSTRYQQNPWLWDFMPPPPLSSSFQSLRPLAFDPLSQKFQAARAELDRSPNSCVEALEAFSQDLKIEELTYVMLQYLNNKSNNFALLRCWLSLRSEIVKLMGDPASKPQPVASPVLDTELDAVHDYLIRVKESNSQNSTAAADTAKFLQWYKANAKPYEDNTTKTWQLARVRRLDQILRKQNASNRLVRKISDHLRQLSNSNIALSTVYHQFQSNVCEFYAIVTGTDKDGVAFQDVFKKLRDAMAQRHQQWGPLYNTIRELRAELATKQQIITCLGFRHVLETLPDQEATLKKFSGKKAQQLGATGYWRRTWQLAVEEELIVLLYESITPTTSSLAGSSSSSLATSKPSSILRQVLQHDFEEWIKKSKQKPTQYSSDIISEYSKMMGSRSSSTTGLVVASSTSGPTPSLSTTSSSSTPPRPNTTPNAKASATAAPTTASGPQSTYTHLFTTLGLNYAAWNGYERGLGLYSELSSSIHRYNDQYEVDKTNWARSDWLVLRWLKPELESDGSVDWVKARSQRDLPQT